MVRFLFRVLLLLVLVLDIVFSSKSVFQFGQFQ
jgi:hypothetical protein